MRILVIEDEKKIAKAIKRGLTQESFAVGICFDSEEGIELDHYAKEFMLLEYPMRISKQ
ncbi:MAG: hypothetical protein NT111_01725 [Patescibacteria group bacterium]|jgi:DNA-binding response OmpR family regulator|nr:hypothetical protein [Patescibacteria group bacterium]